MTSDPVRVADGSFNPSPGPIARAGIRTIGDSEREIAELKEALQEMARRLDAAEVERDRLRDELEGRTDWPGDRGGV